MTTSRPLDGLEDQLRTEVHIALTTSRITQAAAAKELGLSEKHVSQLLTGLAPMSLRRAQQFLRLCGLTLTLAINAHPADGHPARTHGRTETMTTIRNQQVNPAAREDTPADSRPAIGEPVQATADAWVRRGDGTWALPFGDGVLEVPAAVTPDERAQLAAALASAIRPGDEAAALKRVLELNRRWTQAGPPPLGTSVSRWWDARLIELHQALRRAPQEK
ncbi:helix-turn-helix domain-containing protein [Streptomyces cylindrosporus]|uniref:Helix-turn-helix transcriptional regulator n=1 Tax=Streptomyces cylindrosporus TaxID=2927583 RepID=A0ABS9YK47_9ACTN|nr:helix-turn-helix transcriptional regulator [Streptomyces cylindrosporus]MCI3277593.1 helix-turn-helix transcriptional regulator [Streptomyces cylindrosporus]